MQKKTPACETHKQPQLRGTDWDIWCAPSESVVLWTAPQKLLLEEYMCIVIPWRLSNTPRPFYFISLSKKNALYFCLETLRSIFCIFFLVSHSQHLQLRGLDSWQQSSEDSTLMPSGDEEVLWPLISIIILHFTLADGIKKKHHLAKGVWALNM